MPRANRHIQPGNTYHITHRCHDRAFLLKFSKDRQAYRAWLRDGVVSWNVQLMTYCITSNHVHLLVRSENTTELARFMQKAAGGMAQAYNLRKGRTGAFWSDRYHATMIEDGEHLWRCMKYIDLNMVRAGVVSHPSKWEWTGWGELMGKRKRNTLLNFDAILQALDVTTETAFRIQYNEVIEDALARKQVEREPWWSDAVAVGSPGFTGQIEQELKLDYSRRRLETCKIADGGSVLREASATYGAENSPEKRAIGHFSGYESKLTC